MERPRSTRLRVLIPFAIVTLIWGTTWIVIRDQLAHVPPSWSVSYRFTLAGLVMLAWAKARGEKLFTHWSGIGFALVLGTAQFVLNFNFVYRAEQHITSGVVAIVFALLLVPNAILSRLFLAQRMGRQLLVGSAVAIAGVAMLFLHEARLSPVGPQEALIGIGLALTAVMCASTANVMQATQLSKRWPMAATIGWAMLLGGLLDAGFALAVSGPPVFDWRPSYLAGLVYLAVLGSAVSFSLYFSLIREIGPAKAAYTSVLIPVVAMIFSTIFEGYRWSWLAASGAVLVIAGLVLALKARRPNR